jgi:hypothetical protein
VKEVDRGDALGLVGEEFAPSRAGAARGRIDAGSVKDLPDGGDCDGVAEPGQLAVDSLVPPPWVLPRQAQDELLDRGRRWRAARAAAPRAVVPLRRDQAAVPGQQVPGVTGKMSRQRWRGMRADSAASQNRSAGS